MKPLRALARLLRRPSAPPARKEEIEIVTAEEARRSIASKDPAAIRFLVPTELVCMHGAFRYIGGWHPFNAALEHGPEALRQFYDRFRPADLAAMYHLEKRGLKGEDLPPWVLPWLPLRGHSPAPEMGLSVEHGVSYYGPVSAEKLLLEQSRLDDTLASIRRHGYDPGAHSDITGWFLERGGETRFFVRGGKHRASALARLGAKRIPVTLRETGRAVLTAEQAAEWPLVREGLLDAQLAASVFGRYFDWNGLQQHRFLHPDASA